MKKILFDLTGWQTNGRRGIGRYTLNFALALIKHSDFDISFIYSKRWQLIDLPESILRHKIYSYEDDISEKFDFLILSDPMCHDLDTLKITIKCCNVITSIFYDLIPLVYAKDYLSNPQVRLDYIKCLESLKVIDFFFCISKSTESDLQKYLKIPPNKTSCIYGGADVSKFSKNKQLVKNHDLVMIPGDDLRKNYIRGCEAFARTYSAGTIPSDSRLRIICGCGKQFQENIKNCLKPYPSVRIGKQVVIEGYVEDEVLVNAVSSATASLFPSLYEGLGLPIIESFAAGTACISSNNSSCAELNIKDCQFNPKSVEDISKKITEIYNSQELRKKSVEFGTKFVSECSWDNTVNKTITILSSLKKIKPNRIAMFGCIPPSASGIAIYNKLIADNATNCIDIFGDNQSTYLYYSNYNRFNKIRNIFPECSYEDLSHINNYTHNIFVLGNSEHNLSALKTAINNKPNNSWLYIHDGELISLIKPYCKAEDLDVKTLYFTIYGDKQNHYGVKVIQHLTGIKNILVNTEKCKNIVKKELKGIDGIVIKKLFHPIKDYRTALTTQKISSSVIDNINNAKNSGKLLIGTFGVPSDHHKGTNIVLKAILEARKLHPEITPVIAGYQVNHYLNEHPDLDIAKIGIIFDKPSDIDLSYIMSKIDLAIQLRPHTNGEASGVLSELVCYNKNIIVSSDFTNGYNKDLFIETPLKTTVNQLSRLILKTTSTNNIHKNDTYLSKYSPKEFINTLTASIGFKL